MKRLVVITLVTILYISISISAFAARNAAIRVNQEGYRVTGDKQVMLVGQNYTSFTVKRVSDDSTRFTGSFANAINDNASGDSVRIGNFSALTEAGDFYVQVTGLGESFEFRIDEFVFEDVLYWLMRGYYSQRCGQAVSLTHRGTTFSHPACHMNDATYAGSTGLSGNHDMTGGWHDAGDYGKYALNSGITTGTMFLMFERYKKNIEQINLDLSYSGGTIPDVLEEIKYNFDWMRKMQHTNGGVFHKLSNGFPQGIMPENDNDTRYIFEISSAATGDFAAVAAIASRIFQSYDATYAAQCLTAAENAWAFLENNPGIVPDGGFTDGSMGGVYGDADDSDERLWAAVELFNATGNTTYNTYVAAHYNDRAITLISDNGDDWKELHPIAFMSYIQSLQPTVNTTVVNAMKTTMQSHVNTFRTRINSTNGYMYPLESGDYYWGSNSIALNRAMRLLEAYEIFGDQTYKDAAEQVLHYILGRNPMDNSYMTYVGEKHTSNPHHQPSIADGITPPWPGIVAGGPNEYSDGPGSPAKCYVDDAGNYTSNEVAINWYAAYAYVLAAFVPTPGPTFTPTETPTSICWPLICTFTQTYTPTETPTPISGIYVNCGGDSYYSTGTGITWQADQNYSAGSWGVEYGEDAINNLTDAIANTNDDQLYNDERWSGNGGQPFEYKFDNTGNGWFMVTLKFAEHWMYAADSRRFNVDIEGVRELSNFSIYEAAGNRLTAYDVSFPVQVTDGQLNIYFSKGSIDNATINGISIETYYPPTYTPTNTNIYTDTPTNTPTDTDTPDPSWTKTFTPTETFTFTETQTYTETNTPTETPTLPPFDSILVNVGGPEYTDAEGTWVADFGFTGGTAADNSGIIVTDNTDTALADDTLYETERYDSPSYAFNAIADGEYIVTMKFTEAYWDNPGDRVFDVQIEGVTVVTDLDLVGDYAKFEAHDVVVSVTVSDGQLNITSSATSDGALFNAIKIEQYIPSTFTPSETQTASDTPTNTPTETYTFTDTVTDTPTNTKTHTPTDTDTPVSTETETLIPTSTETDTLVPSVTETETLIPTSTETDTLVPSVTETETLIPTSTETDTLVPSVTETETLIPTSTETDTLVPSVTNTETFIPSDTFTHTPTETFTETFIPSETPTGVWDTETFTQTYTPLPTDTFTNTPTETQTFTHTEIPTATETDTLIPSVTETETLVPSVTETDTLIPSATETETLVPSVTETETFIPSNTFTDTPTETNTFTHTQTETFTETFIPSETPTGIWNTETFTETHTPTETFTVTETYTETATATATYTDTETLVPTSTYTKTDLPTATNTDTPTETATNSQLPTVSYTDTPTTTHTPLTTNTFTPTPTLKDSDMLEVVGVQIYPNPFNPLKNNLLRINVTVTQRSIGKISLRIYTSSYRLVKEVVFEDGALVQILNNSRIEYEHNFENFANGTYYFIIVAEKDGEEVRSKIDKLIILK